MNDFLMAVMERDSHRNTAAAKELKEILSDKDITINATGNSFEQYGSLGENLTTSDTWITAQAGDVFLYNSNTLCFFYGSNNDFPICGTIHRLTTDFSLAYHDA